MDVGGGESPSGGWGGIRQKLGEETWRTPCPWIWNSEPKIIQLII